MTTPSLNKTFDTSLIDVQRSFSSTDTAPSESSMKENTLPPQQQGAGGRQFKAVTTEELYAQWAQTYDTDNNFLQAVDDMQTEAILPRLLTQKSRDGSSSLDVLDFGCGTGRTTLKLLRACPAGTRVSAWDASAEMLALAQRKCSASDNSSRNVSLDFRKVDFSDTRDLPSFQTFDILISTLVLEHVSCRIFFECVSRLLKPGGLAFISNMHPDMGQLSVAGFDDENQRLMGRSHLHGVKESVDAAREFKLGVRDEDVQEASVTAEMIDAGLVPERGRKWVGKQVWFGFIARKL